MHVYLLQIENCIFLQSVCINCTSLIYEYFWKQLQNYSTFARARAPVLKRSSARSTVSVFTYVSYAYLLSPNVKLCKDFFTMNFFL